MCCGCVLQVTDPHNFLAKEVANVSKRNMTAEYCSFLQLAEQMKRHFEGEQESMLQTSPTIVRMCNKVIYVFNDILNIFK